MMIMLKAPNDQRVSPYAALVFLALKGPLESGIVTEVVMPQPWNG